MTRRVCTLGTNGRKLANIDPALLVYVYMRVSVTLHIERHDLSYI